MMVYWDNQFLRLKNQTKKEASPLSLKIIGSCLSNQLMAKLRPYQFQNEWLWMEKYDQIKMLELVKVEDPDAEGGLTLHFQENKTLKIKNVDGKLVADFV